jgi:hypothetical protein
MFNAKKNRIKYLERCVMELNYIVKLRRGAIKQSIDTIMELNNSVDFWKFIADERKKNVKRLGELVLEGTNDITTLQNINATFKKEISDLTDRLRELEKPMCATTHPCIAVFPSQVKDAEEMRKEEEVMKKKATKKGGGKPC